MKSWWRSIDITVSMITEMVCDCCSMVSKFHTYTGHCKVPDRYKPDKPLGTWVKKQRLANACDQLKEDRKQMLDDLGFVWRITDKTDAEKWDRM
jgi:Helicase associated domain